MKEISLPHGLKAIVDDEDYESLSRWRWRYSCGGVRRWTSENGSRFTTFMHRAIMQCPEDKEIDHINRNPLDNRKCNLRITDRSGNCRNMGPMKGGTSAFKGVHWNTKRKRWIAKIYVDGKSLQLGSFHDEIKAAQTYDLGAKKHFKEFAYLNFPNQAALEALKARHDE